MMFASTSILRPVDYILLVRVVKMTDLFIIWSIKLFYEGINYLHEKVKSKSK